MRKIWAYLLGVVTGIVISVIFISIIVAIYNVKNDPGTRMIKGITFFEQPGEVIGERSFEVFQALGDGTALANGKGDGIYTYSGLLVLLYNKEGKPYYDEQVVTVSKGKCARQIGLYRYKTKSEIIKTVPVVEIMDEIIDE